MKIVVSEIPDEGLDIEDEITPGRDNIQKIRLKVKVEKSGQDVFIRGDIAAYMDFVCSRCLKEFSREMKTDIDLSYRPVDELKEIEKQELAHDELDTGFYSDNEIDLEDVAIEQLLLNAPMKALCQGFCKGICPSCGTNLNEMTCRCENGKIDVRMKKLEDYMKGKKG